MSDFLSWRAVLITTTVFSALAASGSTNVNTPVLPGVLANARYVYVASYDGDQFNPNLLPEDRAAISSVENAIQIGAN